MTYKEQRKWLLDNEFVEIDNGSQNYILWRKAYKDVSINLHWSEHSSLNNFGHPNWQLSIRFRYENEFLVAEYADDVDMDEKIFDMFEFAYQGFRVSEDDEPLNTMADVFVDYYKQRVGTLSVYQALNQAYILFNENVDKSASDCPAVNGYNLLFFNDGSFIKYNYRDGIKT